MSAAAASGRRRLAALARRSSSYALVAPAMLAVGILAAGIVYLLWRSLHSYDPFTARQGAFSTDQYRRLVEPPSGDLYRGAVLRTLFVSLTATAVATVVALPVAYVVVRMRSAALRAVALVALLAPFLMGEAPRAFGWSLILGRDGLLAGTLGRAGIASDGLLGTTWAVWIGLLQVSIPLATLVALPAVRRIDPNLERAAQTLGAPASRIWLRVVVPLSAPGLLAAAAVVFLINMAEYDLPQVVGLGRAPFAANLIADVFNIQNDTNLGAAFSLALIAISVATLGLSLLVGRLAIAAAAAWARRGERVAGVVVAEAKG